MTRRRGLSLNTSVRTERRDSGVVLTMRDGGTPFSARVHVDEIAQNPRNPAARVDHIEDLVASIQRRGVLVPVLLTPVDEWVERHPEDADAVVGRQWVAQDGHRRIAAARAAGRLEVPFAVRGVDIDEALIRLHTAKSLKLTPIEEAQQYRWLLDNNEMTQQEVAAETGVSQGHVAKRLKLLRLPESVQSLVDYGRVDLRDALALVDAKDDDLMARVATEVSRLGGSPAAPAAEQDDDVHPVENTTTSRVDLALVTRRATEAREFDRGKELARQQASELGAEYCDNVQARLGAGRFGNQVYAKAKITAAAKAHNLLVVPTRGEPTYYLIEDSENSAKAAGEQRRMQAVLQARSRALRTAASARVPTAQIQETLATLVLTGLSLGSGEGTTQLAYDLAREADLAPGGLGDLAWRRSLTSLPRDLRMQHAWIIALAALESFTRSRSEWGSVHAFYYSLLGSVADYVPGEWEQGRLDAITSLGGE